jgi:hypothetical protein
MRRGSSGMSVAKSLNHLANNGYPNLNLLAGLMHYWPLSEASGNRNDVVSNAHLTDVNTVGQGDGKLGKAGSFTAASSQYLKVADRADLRGVNDFWIAAWINPASTPANAVICSKYDAVPKEFNFYIQPTNIQFTIISATYVNLMEFAFSTGTNYLVEAWYDSVNGKSYVAVNNSAGHEKTGITPITAGSSEFRIGTREEIHYFDGLIGPLGYWNKVPTQADRDALWNGGDGIDMAAMLALIQ